MKDVYVIYNKTGKLFINENEQMTEKGKVKYYNKIGDAMRIAAHFNSIIGYPTFKVFVQLI